MRFCPAKEIVTRAFKPLPCTDSILPKPKILCLAQSPFLKSLLDSIESVLFP